METKIIKVNTNGGPISLHIDASRFPQSVAGIVGRYKPGETKGVKTGIFNTHIHDVQLGVPADIDQNTFLVRVVIIAVQPDDPPTPYQVVISVLQNGLVLSHEMPEDGSGQLGKEDIVFDYILKIVMS